MFKKILNKGFTTIELIIVITIMTIVFGLAIGMQGRFYVQAHLDTATQEIIDTVKLAQNRAATNYLNDSWGVYFDDTNNIFTLFKSDTYGAEPEYDLSSELIDALDMNTLALNNSTNQIVFEQITGRTGNYGSLVINNNQNESKTIYINSAGIPGLTSLNSNGSGDGEGPGPDIIPPAAATISVITTTETSVELEWSAPGDDNNDIGTQASIYDIRYYQGVGLNWGVNTTNADPEPIPATQDTVQTMNITGLSSGTYYEFAMKSQDEVGNESAISNIVSATTDTAVVNEADSLDVGTSSAALASKNKQLKFITIDNLSGSQNITIDKIRLTWTGVNADRRIKEIRIDGVTLWNGNQASGVLIDITDFILTTSGGPYDIDFFKFNKSMSGGSIDIEFHMSDGSIQSITGDPNLQNL